MKRFTLYACCFLLLLLSSQFTFAQFTANGVVTDAKGESLIGVTVAIKGTTTGTSTDIDGKYALKVPGESAVLVFSYIGYRTVERAVIKSNYRLDVVMQENITDLDEVVISGLATSVKRSNLANSVESITAEQLTGIAPPQTFDALQGKFKGANIITNSGAPGGGISVKLRGITSIDAPSEPLYIIDGIYVDNSSIAAGIDFVSNASGGGSSDPFSQDNPSNRIADLDPEDIENIEILKGASAAAIYGSRAAGGVIIITTKRGKDQGKYMGVNVSQTMGFTQATKLLGVRDWNVDKVKAAFGVDTTTGIGLQEGAFLAAQSEGRLVDYEDELYGETGLLSNTRLSIQGGGEKTNFYTGFSVKNENGIVKNTGYDRYGVRFNLDHKLTKWLDIGLSNYYVISESNRGFFNNDNSGTTMGISLLSTPPWAELQPDDAGNYPDNPFAASNFLQTRDLLTNRENVNRYIGGGRITIRLFSNEDQTLKIIGRGGIDRYSLNTTAIFPRELQFEKNNNGTNGASIQGVTINNNNNLEAFLVHQYYPSDKSISLVSQVGITRLKFSQNTIIASASELIGSQTNIDQGGALQPYQNIDEQEDIGFFIQEEVNIDNVAIITLGVRGDKSSNNGDVNKLFYYPKASLAFNLHELSFWDFANPNQLKIRAAFGQSGNFARFGSKYTSFPGTIIDGIAGSLISTTLGNADVEPERQTEVEVGFDLGFAEGNVVFDATYYLKTVKDLLIQANVPTSTGFVDQVTNVADLQNQGVEMGLNLQLFSNKEFNWNSRTAFWLNRSEVTRLDIPAFNTGAFGATLGTYRIEEGKSATQIVGIGPADADTDGDGLVVWGDAEPDFQMSFSNNMYWKNFELGFLLHWKHGSEGINLTTLLSDIFQTSPDYDETDLDPTGATVNGDFRLAALGVTADPWIQPTGYVRLREVGLYYSVPRRSLEKAFSDKIQSIKVGFSGNNLLNFWDYPGYDPEVSNFVGAGTNTGVEVAPFPSSKRVNFHVNVGF